MEYLERGLVAMRQLDDSVVLSWRWLGNESDTVAFNVYRSSKGQTERLNSEPIADRTNFSAPAGPSDPQDTYYVRAIVNGEEQEPSRASHVWSSSFLQIPIQSIPDYQLGDASVADLDGDGELEIIVHQDISSARQLSSGSYRQTDIGCVYA